MNLFTKSSAESHQTLEEFWRDKPYTERPRLNPAIHSALGPLARPTGGVRVVTMKGSTTVKLQYEWMGYGTGWFDVPVVDGDQ